jgi:predicted flap endonuclease-1-like 5' DNA nuclease
MFEQAVTAGPGTATYTQHTFEILIMLLGAFLLGLWLGWLIWSKYKQQADNLMLENQSLKGSLQVVNTDLNLEQNKAQILAVSQHQLTEEVRDLEHVNTDLFGKVTDLEETLQGVKTENLQLENTLVNSTASTPESAAVPMEVIHSPVDVHVQDLVDMADVEEPIIKLPELNAPTIGLAGMGAAAAAGISKFGMPEVKLPEVELPKFGMPEVKLPEVELPKFDLPEVKLPEVELPKFGMPEVKLPVVELPKVELPKFGMPEIGLAGLGAAAVALPKVETPELELPTLEVPKVETPVVETPVVETPVIEAPEVETPVIEAPEVVSAPRPEPIKLERIPKEVPLEVVKTPTIADFEANTAHMSAELLAEGGEVIDMGPSIESREVAEPPTQKATMLKPATILTVAALGKTDTAENLKIIEGIGPKIEEILHKNGIYTYAQLAASPVSRLKEMLAAEGNRFVMHDPATWPAQSLLAANGEWENLKAYQVYLNAGKKPD